MTKKYIWISKQKKFLTAIGFLKSLGWLKPIKWLNLKSTFWWGLYFFFFFSIFFLLYLIFFLLLISQNTVYKKKTLISHVSTTMLFSQLSKGNIWKSVFQRELVQCRSRAGIFWWYSHAQFKRRFTPQIAVQFLKKMPQLTQTAVSPHTMVRIANLCLNLYTAVYQKIPVLIRHWTSSLWKTNFQIFSLLSCENNIVVETCEISVFFYKLNLFLQFGLDEQEFWQHVSLLTRGI